jgi:hypothetical protein
MTTTKPKPLPPAGQRPPAPPWLKIIAWVMLLLCLGLASAHGSLLVWAATQPVMPLMQPIQLPTKASSKPITPNPANGNATITRITALAAAIIRMLLLAPGYRLIQAVGVLGLTVIGLELCLAAVILVIQTQMHCRQSRIHLRLGVPKSATNRSIPEIGADLYRALHRQLPTTGTLSGQAPWLVLTCSCRPDEPVELGVIVCGDPQRLTSWVVALRKTLQGLLPDAVIDVVPDRLIQEQEPDRFMAWAEWQLAAAPFYPLRLADDQTGSDLMGPLIATLSPRQGIQIIETHLVLQPRLDDHALWRGWRADGMRRLLKLQGKHEYAFTPDAKALEAKLQGSVFHTLLRAVVVGASREATTAELREIDAVIGQYAARSGSRLQRLVRRAGRLLRIARQGAAMRPYYQQALPYLAGVIVTLLLLLFGRPVSHFFASLIAIWPVLDLPRVVVQLLPQLWSPCLVLLLGLGATALLQQWLGFTSHAITRINTRVPRAVPLPGLLWGSAWHVSALLGPEELTALWHIPTTSLGRLVRWLPCRYLPPPPHAFVPTLPVQATPAKGLWWKRTKRSAPSAPHSSQQPTRLVLGIGRHHDQSEAPVGLPLRDARQGLAFTAPPGVGKTQLASNLADQLRPCGYTLIDGKGDDAGNLVETMRRRIPLIDEARLVVLDVLDAEWPIGLNPLSGVSLSDSGAIDQVLGQIEAIFARLDPETWTKAPRMKNYLRKATLLVLAGETHPTIAHVKQALLDERYRQVLLPQCTNVEVVDFWTIEFPQIGEQQRASRDALVSRFDMLLDSELTRFLFNQTLPALSFRDAIAERLIVLAPLPHRTLGGLAGPVGMLLFQGLMRAAFTRPGTDQTRTEYGFIGDEFQVLVENCDTKDIRDALTQVRAFGIVTIIANQLHAQLGDLAEYALTAISNRILLRTQEPDATLYARHYAESGITAADISGQEPREHQYAWIGVDGKLTKLFSMQPLPWQPALELHVPPHHGQSWQCLLPPNSPTPTFDQQILALIYGEHSDDYLLAQALAAANDEQWLMLIRRWDAIRSHQRGMLLRSPGCIPDTLERQRWLSRLRAARPRVLAMAEYARIRQAVQPASNQKQAQPQQRNLDTASPSHLPGSQQPSQQPHFTALDQRDPARLARLEPNDRQFDDVSDAEILQ